MASAKKILKKTGKVFLWILGSLVVLVLLLFLFINLPVGKRTVRNQAQKYLRNKLKTRVDIGSIDYSLPKWLELKDVYFEDQKKDTLLSGGELRVDINMLALLRGNTDINKVVFRNIIANISRPANDSVFNYEFITKAFTGNKSTTTNPDTAELKLSLDQLVFENVGLNFRDRFGGNEFRAVIKNLDLTTNKFAPDRMKFGIDKLTANGVKFLMTTTAPSGAIPVKNSSADTAVTSPYELLVSANKILLTDVEILADNKVTGMYYANDIARLSGSDILFSIADAKGTADSLYLEAPRVVFASAKKIPAVVSDSSVVAALPWLFAVKNLAVKNTNVKFDDVNKPAVGGLDFAHLNAKGINAAVNGFRFSKDTTTALVSQFAFSDTGGFKLDTTHINFVMTDKLISATDIYIKTPRSLIQRSVQVSFDSLAALTTAPANSMVAAVLNGTSISFDDLYILVPALEKSLPRAQFAGQYLNLNTEIRGNLARLFIPSLQLSGLSGTRLSGRGTVYNLTDPNKLAYDLYIDNSTFFKRDLIKFVPPANRAQFANLPDVINFKGHFTGDKNNVVANVDASSNGLSFAGLLNLKNISDPTKLSFDVAVSRASVNRNVIQGFLPPAALQQIELPQQISAVGKLSGNTENITTDLRVSSSYGPISIKGFIKNIKDPNRANYDLIVSTPGFMAGNLLKQDTTLGTIAGTFTAKGTGFDYKTMRSAITADVASFGYNKYDYKNARIRADLNGGTVKSSGRIDDENLKLNFDIDANVRGKYPTAAGKIRIDTAILNRLNLTPDTLNLSLTADINAQNLQPRNLDAAVLLDSIRFQSGLNRYRLDTVSLIASSAAGVDSIVLKSAFAEVHAGGAFDYDKIGFSLQNYINSYYKIPGYVPVTANVPEQQFGMKGTIYESPIIKGFVPGLTDYEEINFTGSYASADTDSALNLNVTMPSVSYTTTRLGNGAVNINSRNGRINYAVTFDTLTTPGNTLYATSLAGAAARDSLSVNVVTKNVAGRNWFGLGGSAFVDGDKYSFRLQDSLLLNYERWNVAPDNYIQYSPAGIVVNNFRISSDTATIAIASQQLTPGSPIDINIDNFNLKSISSIINQDTVFLAGVLDMKANVSDLDKPLPAFTGNATLSGLAFMQNLLGNVTFNAQKVTDNNISADLALLGPGNDLSVKGNYYLNDVNRQFDADLQLRQLSFRTLQALSAGQLQNSRGNISGNVNLTGKFADPRWSGQFTFDTAQFALTQLGTPYRIDKQKIVFEYPNITFPQFTITDSLNHKLVIDGDIRSRSMTDFVLNVDVNANDFILVNAKKTIESQVYGFAAVDINVSTTGTSAAPNIEGDISLNDKSDVHIVLPQASYAKDDGNTIVRFIDKDTFDFNPPVLGFEPAKKATSAFAQFLNYNLNIELTKAAALTILIDPVTGDEIKVQGDARLNAGVDPGGNLVLAGTYELDQGYYDLHYQFLQRKFNLIKGSTITFAGEPLQATANLTAEYIANTSSRDLLSNEVTDVTGTLANSLNQKLPFRVILYLSGPLSKPNITFDVRLPEESNIISADLRSTIENKLQQIRSDPASVNKQVFSLLLLGRFTGEQSSDFFKGNGGEGGGFNSLARQSVSGFLSSALNQIAGDLFKGIDIDLNLNSYNDYSNGGANERTDLNVAVSKSFANDRLTVSVGQNFGISGQDGGSAQAGGSGGFKPDVSVGYKLTADGKYLLRAYTKNQYEVTVDGFVVENGVAFVVTMDYNKFRELFRRNPRKSRK